MEMIVERKVPHFLPEPHSAGVASEDEDADEELLPGDRVDNARP